MKQIIIINGSGGTGKDTIVRLCSKHYGLRNVSTVDLVKRAGTILGWDGTKEESDRLFLSDLKDLADIHYDCSFKYISQEIEGFMQRSDQQLCFIHCREPENIRRLFKYCRGLDYSVRTLLVTNTNTPEIHSNHADANVLNYNYDYHIKNNGSYAELKKAVKEWLAWLI